MQLTKNELEIMDVLWETGKPLSRGEIIDQSKNKSWKAGSIHVLLNSLLEKKAIWQAGYTRCGKSIGRIYAPNISVEEYYISTLNQTKTRPDFSKLILAYINQEGINKEEIRQALKLLETLL